MKDFAGTTLKLIYRSILLTVILSLFNASISSAATNTATAGNNWSTATWSLGHVPLATEDVVINSGVNLTITTAAVCGSLTIGNATNRATTLTLGAGGTLTVNGTTGNLKINPSNVNKAFALAVAAGSVTIAGNITFPTANTATVSVTTGTLTVAAASTVNANSAVTLTAAGTINFNGLITHTGGTISNSGTAGTFNFAGGYNLSAGTLTTMAGETLKFGNNFTNSLAAGLTLNATSIAVFTANTTVTPTTAITFGNVTVNSGAVITLAGNVTVAGNWVNNASAACMAGAFDVTFSGAAKTIGGTSGTTFSRNIVIANGATITLNTGLTFAATSMTINTGATATSLTHAGTAVLNLTNATINQSTAANAHNWAINSGSANVAGTLSLAGVTATANFVAEALVTTGSLTAATISFAANTTAANLLVLLNGTGSITITNPIALSHGEFQITGAGTINFNGLITHTGGSIVNSGTAGTFNFAGGYNLSTGTLTTMAGETLKFGNNFTNSLAAGLTLNATSIVVFTANSTVTPTTAITFGNVTVNSGAVITLAGNVTVAGNWVNNGSAACMAGAFDVTFSGAAKTIGGTSGTTFSRNIIIANGATITLNTGLTFAATAMTINTGATATSLTHAGTAVLNLTNATINQCTAARTNSWSINSGSATVSGTLSFPGTTATANFVSRALVTTGSLAAATVNFAVNTRPANLLVLLNGAGTITVTNPIALSHGEFQITGTGSINFNGLITHTGGSIVNSGTAGTFNFAGGYNLSTGTLTMMAGETLKFGNNFTNIRAGGLTLNATSTAVFTANATITPTTAITFGNVTVSSGAVVTLAGNVTVAGNWVNNGSAACMAGAFDVTFSGAAKTLGGTSGTTFSRNIIIANGATITLNTGLTFAATALTINTGATATSLAHAGTAALNLTNATINQSTAANAHNWAINSGSANVTGILSLAGVNATANFVAETSVTTGSLTAATISFAANTTPANLLVLLSGAGSVTITNALVLSHGEFQITGTGSINFNGLITHTGGTIINSGTAGTFNFGGGYNLSTGTLTTMAGETLKFGNNFTSSRAGGLTLNATSTSVFTANATVTQTTVITFGNVTVNPSATLIFPASVTAAGALTINGTLTVSGSNVLTLGGNFVNNGTYNANTGSILFNGASSQSVSGTAATNFYNIQDNNAAGLNINSNANLYGTLTLNASGVFNATGSGSGVFTVKSTSLTAGGRIAALPTPANFSGAVTIERFINGPQDWRYLSMPITNGNVGSWQASFPVTGNFTNPSPAGGNVVYPTATSIYYWDATAAAWVAVGSGASTSATPLSNTVGYSPYTYLSGNFTLTVSGTIGKGNISIPLGTGGTGFNLAPNPYPSAIDWDNVALPAGLSSSMWIRIANNTFTSYVQGGVATNAPFVGWTGEIATGQSFWVKSSSASSLALTENTKTANAYQFLRTSVIPNVVRIALSSDTQRDEAVIWFNNNATDTTDAQFDALKRKNGNYTSSLGEYSYLNLSTFNKSPSVDYAINGLSSGLCSKAVSLKIEDAQPGNHVLSFTNLTSLDLNYQLVLKDNYLAKQITIADSTNYSFSITSDTSSFGTGRFQLSFSTLPISQPAPTIAAYNLCDPDLVWIHFMSSPQYNYQVLYNGSAVTQPAIGTGDTISMSIAKTQLVSGKNSFDLVASANGGCASQTYHNAFIYQTRPLAPAPVVASAQVCSSTKATFVVSGSQVGSQYYWYDSQNSSTPLPGTNGPTFVTDTLMSSQTFFVAQIDSNGCAGQRAPATAKVITMPHPAIAVSGTTLNSNYGKGNQWNLDGTPVPNANDSIFHITQSGVYSLTVTNLICSTTTADVVMTITAIEPSATGRSATIYPNPVSDYLTVDLQGGEYQLMKIIDAEGRLISTRDLLGVDDEPFRLNLSDLPGGLYLMTLSTTTSTSTIKFIKK